MLDRIKGAALLDPDTYELVENNKRYLPEAIGIVVVTSVASGIGNSISGGGVDGFVAMLVSGLLMWVIWSAAAFYIGTKYFGGTSSMGRMLRVMGFASVPLVLGLVPWVGLFVGGLWALAASVIAIRQGMDLPFPKAVLTAAPAWLVLLVARGVLNIIL